MECLAIRRLLRDRCVRGTSPWFVSFFMLWGYWNCYFYPAVGAWWSFGAGILLALANTVWVAMAFWFAMLEGIG